MSEIADFLNRQYDRIEAAARAATDGPWDAEIHRHRKTRKPVLFEVYPIAELEGNGYGGVRTAADATHIAIHDPDYVLADIASKRRIVERCEQQATKASENAMEEDRAWTLEPILFDLAAPFSDEPGYKQQWAV